MFEDTQLFLKLSKDIRDASYSLSKDEARFLVDAYYLIQNDRKRTCSQLRSMEQEPHEVLQWLAENNKRLESAIKTALDVYSDGLAVGQWMRSIVGIGPVIASGMLAHIDIEKAPTVGHIWNFAGLNPDIVWEKGKRRPFCGEFKTLCAYRLGECFVKTQNHADSYYGPLFRKRKALEWARNLNGLNAEQAAAQLAKYRIRNTTDAYKWYSGQYMNDYDPADKTSLPTYSKEGRGTPMLPPAHIHARARRYVVKLFLSHLHHVMYLDHFGEPPPKPFAIEHLGHAHYIAPPNLDLITVAASD